ncbi:MAG TPA: aldehyde dehydrogenase family protein [Myxococcota bacterium]|nr:aldehyde dehydrogenase family protein [Myxococcota bacterium]
MADASPFEARGDLVDGRLVLPERPDGELVAVDPGDTRETLGAFPFAAESAERAVAAARRAFPAWRDSDPAARAAALLRFREALRAEQETFAGLIAREVGKPLWEARTEVGAMLQKFDITLGAGLDGVAERSFDLGGGQTGRWRANARGVFGVIGPFNFPGHLMHGHVVPALATGNCVVVKPSEKTPAVAQLYAELCQRAGFPAGVANVVQGDATIGAGIAAHPALDGVLFTGSYAAGRRILEATLDQPWKIVALELGGKNGVLVCADADLDAAANAIAFGACVTAGQRCSSTSRIFAERAVADALAERLVKLFRGIAIGHSSDPGAFMGPVINRAARARHGELLAWAKADAAEVLVAGGPADGPRPGHYVRPSLHRLRVTSRASRYQSEEHFVPDAFLVAVDSVEAGLAELEGSDFGLCASIFTRARATYERAARTVRVGCLNWNSPTVGASSKLPFGGLKRSGNDRPAGVTSTLYTTIAQANLEVPEPGPAARYPGFPSLS